MSKFIALFNRHVDGRYTAIQYVDPSKVTHAQVHPSTDPSKKTFAIWLFFDGDRNPVYLEDLSKQDMLDKAQQLGLDFADYLTAD